MREQYSVHWTQSLKCLFKDLGIGLILAMLSSRPVSFMGSERLPIGLSERGERQRPLSVLAYRPPVQEAKLPRSQAQSSYPMAVNFKGSRANLEGGLVFGSKVKTEPPDL